MKRYRYITCGLVAPDEPVSLFRLIAANKMKGQNIAIRITIPKTMHLTKYSCDEYSTVENDDKTLIQDLEPVLVIRVNGRWEQTQGIWPAYHPSAVDSILLLSGYRYDLEKKLGYIRPQR